MTDKPSPLSPNDWHDISTTGVWLCEPGWDSEKDPYGHYRYTRERLVDTVKEREAQIAHLRSLIEDQQTTIAAFSDDYQKDRGNNVIPENDPKVLAELAALPIAKLCERLRGIYDLWPGAKPRRFYTGAIQHEAARRLELGAKQSQGDEPTSTRIEAELLTAESFLRDTPSTNPVSDLVLTIFHLKRVLKIARLHRPSLLEST